MQPLKITIVTPCRNAVRYIQETARSVLDQCPMSEGRYEVEYLVMDGGSTDGTLDILANLASQDSRIKYFSEPDSGMYDALAKGLGKASGQVVGYLNAGDVYHKHAFDVISACFSKKNVDWLTGMNVVYNDYSQVVSVSMPYRYRNRFIDRAIYGGILPFIQQESTFWRRELHDLIDFRILADCRLAGDHYLWRCFSRKAELRPVQAFLGGFRRHPGQLSSDYAAYRNEQLVLSAPASVLDLFFAFMDKIAWYCPDNIKRRFNKNLIWFRHDNKAWVV